MSERDLSGVCAAYRAFFDETRASAGQSGKSEDQAIAEAMVAAMYRLYLLGVEDGMRREEHE